MKNKGKNNISQNAANRVTLLKVLCLSVIVFWGHFVPAAAQSPSKGKVLIILTSAKTLDLQDGKMQPSPGYYLDELTYPLQQLLDAGYEPVFATPGGVKPLVDPFSENKIFFNNSEREAASAKALVGRSGGLQHPKKLSVVVKSVDEYVGILVPGGFGPIQDLATDADLGQILRAFHREAKPTGMICHGPISLISTLQNAAGFKAAMVSGDYSKAHELAKDWIYRGYRLTVFSSGEELLIHQLKGKVTYVVSHALAQAGAHVDCLAQGQINVIEDRELVTGQQPFSAVDFGTAFIAKLNSYTSGK